MSDTTTLTLDEAADLARRALTASGTSAVNAEHMVRAIVAAERDGISSHGLAYVPIYCAHVKCGKIDGNAVPAVENAAPAGLVVDAKGGFAHPAIAAGFAALVPRAREMGIAALGVRGSYNCGVLGYHVERLAEEGLFALGFTNAPASIAPIGGSRAVVGTNPMACAAPDGEGGAWLVIDQSSSVIAKSELNMRAAAGEPIPEGWALDPDGNPTTDPRVGLKGTMVPMGRYKGFGQGLIVEMLAAAMTGATLGINASSFATEDGGNPATGQFFIAIDPAVFSGGLFQDRMGALAAAITGQDGARLPGTRRKSARPRTESEGIKVKNALLERIRAHC